MAALDRVDAGGSCPAAAKVSGFGLAFVTGGTKNCSRETLLHPWVLFGMLLPRGFAGLVVSKPLALPTLRGVKMVGA